MFNGTVANGKFSIITHHFGMLVIYPANQGIGKGSFAESNFTTPEFLPGCGFNGG